MRRSVRLLTLLPLALGLLAACTSRGPGDPMLEFRLPAEAKFPDPEETPRAPALLGIEITFAGPDASRVERRLIAVHEGHHFVTRVDGVVFHGHAESRTSNRDVVLSWDVNRCERRTETRAEAVTSSAAGQTLIERMERPIVTLPIEYDGRPETLVVRAREILLQEQPSPCDTVWHWPDRSGRLVRPIPPEGIQTIEIRLRRSDSPGVERLARIRSMLDPSVAFSCGLWIDYVLDYDAEIGGGAFEIIEPIWATVTPGIETRIEMRKGRPILTWRLCLLRFIEKIEFSVLSGKMTGALDLPQFVVREGELLLLPGPNRVDLGETADGRMELLVSLDVP